MTEHTSQAYSSLEGQNQTQILNQISTTLAVKLQFQRFNAKCNGLVGGFQGFCSFNNLNNLNTSKLKYIAAFLTEGFYEAD